MWKQYRKTFVPIQLMILTICLIGYFGVHMPAQTMASYWLIMQVFAVVGAAWGIRLRSKFQRSKKGTKDLPDLGLKIR